MKEKVLAMLKEHPGLTDRQIADKVIGLGKPQMKGCPYDNAVSEATYKVIKTEFVRNQQFETLKDLRSELDEYVKWFNEKRIHSTLGYRSPLEFKNKALRKIV